MAGDTTLSAKQVARKLGTEAKTLRKFFRDPKSGYAGVGQGGRYDFDPAQLPEIKKKFDSWNSGKAKRNRPTNAEREAAKKPEEASTPAKAAVPRPRRPKNQPAPSPLDGDDLMTRVRLSIGERAKKHNITTDKQGRWVSLPSLEEVRATVPGFAKSMDEAAEKEKNEAWSDAVASLDDEDDGDEEHESD